MRSIENEQQIGRRWRYGVLGVLSVVILGIGGCVAGPKSVVPGPGQEAVLIQKPWFIGHGGVVEEPVSTGRAWVAPSTIPVYVNVQPITISEAFDDLMSSDGVPLDFESMARFQVTDSVVLIKRFGPRWYENNVRNELRNLVRQEIRRYGMNEVAISTSAVDLIDERVGAALAAYMQRVGLPVRMLDFTIGKANPPDAIRNQRIATASEQQRRITMVQTRIAEEGRLSAEQARAAADNAYREKMNLSPEQFVELERIKMLKQTCTDKTHCTFILGAANPVIATR